MKSSYSFSRYEGPFTVWTASLVAQLAKNLLANQETWVQSLDEKDPLEKEMAAHSSILAWEIPWTEEPDGRQSKGSQRGRAHTHLEGTC